MEKLKISTASLYWPCISGAQSVQEIVWQLVIDVVVLFLHLYVPTPTVKVPTWFRSRAEPKSAIQFRTLHEQTEEGAYQQVWLWIHSHEYTARCWMVWCLDESDSRNEGIVTPWEHHGWSPMLDEYPPRPFSRCPADCPDPWIQSPKTEETRQNPQGNPPKGIQSWRSQEVYVPSMKSMAVLTSLAIHGQMMYTPEIASPQWVCVPEMLWKL